MPILCSTSNDKSVYIPRVESSTSAASHPPSSGDPTIEEFVHPTAAVDPPPSALGDSSIRSMLDIVMTI